MTNGITVTHVVDVPTERTEEREGWAISEFRLPVTGADGSATAVFHSIFRPGSTHAKHLHRTSDEITVYLSGHGIVGQSDSRTEVTPGHCRLIPRGSEHFFHNQTADQDAVVIGFYVGAADVAASGYEFRGMVEPGDVEQPRGELSEGVLVKLEDTPLVDTSALGPWAEAGVRLPVGSHNGSEAALLHARLEPGRRIAAHRLKACEQLYFVVEGRGVAASGAQRVPVREGHFVFVPQGVEFALEHAADGQALSILGVLTGAGSLAEAGVTPA